MREGVGGERGGREGEGGEEGRGEGGGSEGENGGRMESNQYRSIVDQSRQGMGGVMEWGGRERGGRGGQAGLVTCSGFVDQFLFCYGLNGKI